MHPSGVPFTNQGFPDFSSSAIAEVKVQGLTGNYLKDAALANQAAGIESIPPNYVWHHVEDGVTMQLIPKSIHSAVRHTGGAAVIRKGGRIRSVSVKLLKTGGVASLSDLKAIERIVGGQLPGSYCDFVNGNDGAAPESNIFKIDATNDSGVTSFIPASQIPSEIDLLGCLPARVFPVAWAEGGNYVYVDLSEGNAVFFWDHELPDSPTRLAEDFGSFLDLLKPFDPKSVKLKPGQVKSVWIHPDFAKKLRGEEPW